MPPVTPARPAGKGPRESEARTLADLVHPDRTNVSESEWIALVQSIANGDQQALHALYERTHRLVFTLMVRMSNDLATAEELTLDVFHDVWRRASTYDAAGGSVVGWIMNQARSRAIDRLRFEQRKKRVQRDLDGPSAAAGPEDLVDVRERGRMVREVLAILTPAERAAIERAFFGERTYREVALELDEPLGTIKTRIRSGLVKLRSVLGGSIRR